jgi:AraC-like DNA-binding protein
MLAPAPNLAAFAKSPFDRCLTLSSVFAWHRGKAANGVCCFGALDGAAVRTLFRVLEMDAHPHAEPHTSIADFRDVTYVDLAAMGAFLELLRANGPRFRTVRKRLVLCPPGERGILLGGMRFQLQLPYEVRLGTELEPFLPWLGAAAGDPFLAWVEKQRAAASGESDVTRALRLALDAGASSLGECARALAKSERALQRSLGEAGTTFRDARRRHRLEKARVLLASSVAGMAEIAGICGFASSQHLATAFRAAFGTTPAAFRARSGLGLAP